MGWDKLKCPIVGSCGDSMALTQTAVLFKNSKLMSKIYVVGQDYIADYIRRGGVDVDKFVYQHLCADNHFPLNQQINKSHDWCFIGQVYPEYEERLKHYRNQIVPQILESCPNGVVAGPGWRRILGDKADDRWIDQSFLNDIYAKCHVTVSIDAHDGDGYASTRPIEMMHAGHCVFIYDHPGMRYFKKYFEEGVHAFYFRTAQEFVERLDYIKRTGVASKVGLAAREVVLNNGWTASAWMKQCLRFLS